MFIQLIGEPTTYIFPAFSLTDRTLQKICMDQAEVILAVWIRSIHVFNSALVQQFPGNVMPKTICNSTQTKFYTSTKTRETASHVIETNTSDKKGVKEVFLIQGFERDTVEILMVSWKKGTFSNITHALKNYLNLYLEGCSTTCTNCISIPNIVSKTRKILQSNLCGMKCPVLCN